MIGLFFGLFSLEASGWKPFFYGLLPVAYGLLLFCNKIR